MAYRVKCFGIIYVSNTHKIFISDCQCQCEAICELVKKLLKILFISILNRCREIGLRILIAGV